MNYKSLLLIPAMFALGAPQQASAYVGFGLNLAFPLYYPAPVYRQTVVYQAQPTAVSERVTPAPGPGYVWISGHWSNRDQRWVWLAGHWELPPSPSAIWAPGHWVQGNAGWVWVDGAWTVGAPPSPPQGPPTPPSGAPGVPVPQPPGAAVQSAPPVPPSAAPSMPPPAAPEVADGTQVYADPPAPIVEYEPVCPYPGYAWVGGFWGWNGGWYWVAGHYARPPFRGAAWVSGGWVRAGRGWAWHGGRWR